MPTRFTAPRRILVTRTDRIGDLVLSTPIFEALRKKFPDAWIAALVFLEHRELVEENPFLDEVLLYDKRGSEKGWLGNLLFSRKIAEKKFDTALHLHATNRMHILTWLAGIRQRVGWNRKAEWTLTHPFLEIKREGKKHESLYNFELLTGWDIKASEEPSPIFPLTGKSALSVDSLLSHLKVPQDKMWIAVHPSASCPSKRWPAVYFAELISKLHRRYDAFFFFVGSRQDRPLIKQIMETSWAAGLDLSGKLTLGMLGDLMKRCRVLISNDSGPVHIASAVGTPVMGLYSRKQPGLSVERWRPLGKKSTVFWKDVGCEVCLAHDCKINFLCLDAILPEEVFQKTCEQLDGRGGL